MIDIDGRIDNIFANCVSVGSPIIAQRISSSHPPPPSHHHNSPAAPAALPNHPSLPTLVLFPSSMFSN